MLDWITALARSWAATMSMARASGSGPNDSVCDPATQLVNVTGGPKCASP